MPWFNDPVEAIAKYSAALRENDADIRALLYRGEAYRMQRQLPEAIADFSRIVDLISSATEDPTEKTALFHAHICRGAANGLNSNPDDSFDDFSRAIDLDPQHHLGYYNRAVYWSCQGEPGKAIDDFTRTIQLKSDYADAFLRRGIELKRIQKFKEAKADFAWVRTYNNQITGAKIGAPQMR